MIDQSPAADAAPNREAYAPRDAHLPCADETAAHAFADHLESLGADYVRRIDGRVVVFPISQPLFLDMVVQWAFDHDLTRGIEMALAACDFLDGAEPGPVAP